VQKGFARSASGQGASCRSTLLSKHPLSAGFVVRLCSFLLLWITVFILTPVNASAAEDLFFRNLESEIVQVGGDSFYPPYEYLDKDGNPAGFNVELTQAIARVMGMEVEINLGAWGDMRRDLAEGRIDILQGMAFTEERRAEVDFSSPHAVVHQSIWNRKKTPQLTRVDALANREVIVMRGSVMHDFMSQRQDGARLILSNSLAESLRLLASGKHDCALVAKLPGLYLSRQFNLSNIEPVPKPLVSQDYGYAVRKGKSSLLARFNEGLTILKQTGEYQQIHARWLGVLEPEKPSLRRVGAYLAAVAVPLLLILGITVVWSRTLQKQVAERTRDLQAEVAERKLAMEELEVRQRQLIQADKMSSLGILVSGVAHEINNPNGVIMLNVPLLQKAFTDTMPLLEAHYQRNGDFRLGWLSYSRMRAEIPELLNETLASAGRIKRIVEDLKNFSRQEDADFFDRIDLSKVAESAVRLVEPTLRKATGQFSACLADDLPMVRGNFQRIEQVVVNLLLNASQALIDDSGEITLTTAFDPSINDVVLTVRDTGTGIDPEHLSHLVDPFFTTKREMGGTGLGLSVSAGIVKEHGGRITFDSALGVGTTVRLLLPAQKESET
jgi:polar amino acid transport system substrate-binding protein